MFDIEKLSYNDEIQVNLFLMRYTDFDPKNHIDALTDTEKQRLATFKSLKRQREFIAVRKLKNELFGNAPIQYNAIGAPYIEEGAFISISHSNNLVGIAHSQSLIGFDLEPIDEKVHRVKEKFLSPWEKQYFDTKSTTELIRIWSAKEALYKLSREKGLLFSQNLLLSKKEKDVFHAEIHTKNQHNSVLLQSEVKGDTVISLNITPLRTVANG